MIIVLKPHTTKDDVSRVENMVKKRGLDTHIVQGKEMTVIAVSVTQPKLIPNYSRLILQLIKLCMYRNRTN